MSRSIKDRARYDITHKKCNVCLEIQPISEFFFKDGNKDGHTSNCKKCRRIINKSYRRKFYYNLTDSEYNNLFEKQDNTCAICGRHMNELKRILVVDHDHITGKVRGLLCWHCNVGLGSFQDNKDVLIKAIEYLNKNKEDNGENKRSNKGYFAATDVIGGGY